MKRILAVMFTCIYVMLLTGCTGKDMEMSAAKDLLESESQIEKNNFDYGVFEGDYNDLFSQRAALTFKRGNNSAEITVAWSGSAVEHDAWVMNVHYENGRFVYNDCDHRRYTLSEGEDDIVTYTDQEGRTIFTGAFEEYKVRFSTGIWGMMVNID